MRRTVFLAAAILVCALAVSAQQHNIDTQKSTLTIHVGKTGMFSGLGHEHEVRARSTVAPPTPARIPRLKYAWMRGSCA